jgi:excisionase family DNA binding protein
MSNDGRAPVRLLLTVEEAAEALTVSRWKVFELIRTRQLRSIKIGGLRRVPRAAIDEYIVRLLAEAG